MGAAVLLQCTSALLSWYFRLFKSMQAADVCFNLAHITAALGIGAAAHVSWDLMLVVAGIMPGEAYAARTARRAGETCAARKQGTRGMDSARDAWSLFRKLQHAAVSLPCRGTACAACAAAGDLSAQWKL
jgi:hypothetical protein